MRAALAVAFVTLLTTAPSAAAQDGTVRDGAARFQVISPTLIRLEYAADGRFEDRPTMLGFHRRIAKPPQYEARVQR